MKTIVSPSTTKNTVSVSTTTKTVTVSGTGTVGPQGGTGATGATGPAGTIAVGSVTTGDAGSSVLITNTGSTTEATLNFTIPKGDTGKTILNGTGAPGSGVGVVGDFYVDTSADTIYGPKDSSGSPWGSGVSFAVANGSVTLAKMANLATDKIIGRTTAGTGVPEALSVHDILNMAGTPSDNYILKYDSTSSQWVPEVDVDTDTTYIVEDGGLTQKNFTTDLNTKLTNIEENATADQTAAEIRTLVGSATDSNVFTDALSTKLAGIAAEAEVNVNADWNSSSGDSQISNKPTLVSLSQVAALAVALG